jgi:hypothetical protein
VPFTQPPLYSTFSRNPFVNLSSLVVRTMTFTPYARGLGIPIHLYPKKFRSLLGRNPTGQFRSPDSRVNPTLDNS